MDIRGKFSKDDQRDALHLDLLLQTKKNFRNLMCWDSDFECAFQKVTIAKKRMKTFSRNDFVVYFIVFLKTD